METTWENIVGRRVLALTLSTHIQILTLKLAWFQMMFHFGKGEWPISPQPSLVFGNSCKYLFDHGDNSSEASSFHNRSTKSMLKKTGKSLRKTPFVPSFCLIKNTKLRFNIYCLMIGDQNLALHSQMFEVCALAKGYERERLG